MNNVSDYNIQQTMKYDQNDGYFFNGSILSGNNNENVNDDGMATNKLFVLKNIFYMEEKKPINLFFHLYTVFK